MEAAAADPAAVAVLLRILSALSTPDTATVRAAESELRAASAAPASVLPLAAAACGAAPAAHERQLAAVLLRRAVRAHYAALAPPARAALKAALLERLPAEPHAAPRRALAAAAAAVCRAEDALWPALTQAAVAMSRSPESPPARAAGFKVFHAVADAVPGKIAPHAPTVCLLIAEGLRDADSVVRVAALDAYAACANAVSVYAQEEPPWVAIGALIPDVAAVARSAVAAVVAAASDARGTAVGNTTDSAAAFVEDEDECARVLCMVFDVFTVLSESGGGAVMRPHFVDVFRFALDVVVPSEVPHAARQGAAEYLCAALSAKPKTLKKAGLVKKALLDALRMALMHHGDDGADGGYGCASDPEEPEADDEADGVDLALRIIFIVCSCGQLSRSAFAEVTAVVPHLLRGDLAPFKLTRAPCSPHHAPTIAYRVIGAIADGCSGEMSTHAGDILEFLTKGALDPARPPRSRGFAMQSIACVISALDVTEISDERRSQLATLCFQSVLAAMRDPSLFVKRNACVALEPTLELFDDDGQVLRTRVTEVLSALEGLGPAAAIEAVSVAAVVAEHVGQDFVSTDAYRTVIDGMVQLMSCTAEAEIPARAAATQSAGIVVSACHDWASAERLAAQALLGMSIDDAGLAEATYAFFAKFAETHGGRVAFGYGRQVLAQALQSCNRDDVVFQPQKDEASTIFGGAGKGIGSGTGDGEDDDDFGMGSFGVRTALLDEKAMATYCVGAMATAVATKEFFELSTQSHPETISNVSGVLALLTSAGSCLDPMTTYFHEEVRAAGTRADVAYALAALEATSLSPQLAFGPSDATQRMIDRLINTLKEDDDVFVVTVALHACCTFCSKVSPSVLFKVKDALIESLLVLIKGAATCQMTGDDEDDNLGPDDGGGEDQDGLEEGDERGQLIDAICDVISALSRSLRGHFVADFGGLLPVIAEKFLSSSALPRNSAIVIGMFADVFLFLNWKRCPPALEPPPTMSERWKASEATVESFATHVFPYALQAASTQAGTSRTLCRNSVFLLGVLFELVGPSASDIWAQLPKALQLFEAMVNLGKDADGALVDNAVGALARVMMNESRPAGVIPSLRNALHLALSAVPIDDDPTENNSVARSIIRVAKSGDFGALEMMADAVVSCLVSAVLLSAEQEATAANGGFSAKDWEDPNDAMACLTAVERSEMVQLLIEMRKKCGDASFGRLNLLPDDASRLSTLLQQ